VTPALGGAAEKWAAKQPGRVEIHKRGIGIVLGKLDDELCLAGIDLDTCRNPETGEMTPWAQEILDKFPSYTEISPSQTGVKIFFLVRMEDKAELARYPKAYRKPGGGDHTPGVECYVGGRYFTITDQLYGNETALRVIPAETVRWLHNVAGPAIKGKASRGEKAGQREQYDANSNAPPWVITHRHFRRADRDEAPDFRAPLPGSPISESMCAWIALICSA
jgi:hypothetical protein